MYDSYFVKDIVELFQLEQTDFSRDGDVLVYYHKNVKGTCRAKPLGRIAFDNNEFYYVNEQDNRIYGTNTYTWEDIMYCTVSSLELPNADTDPCLIMCICGDKY